MDKFALKLFVGEGIPPLWKDLSRSMDIELIPTLADADASITKDEFYYYFEVINKPYIKSYELDGFKSKYDKFVYALLYNTYLLSETWADRRKRLLVRRGEKCELCGNTANLNVHHKTYKQVCNEPDEDLIIVCKDCHKKQHPIKRELNYTAKTADYTNTL